MPHLTKEELREFLPHAGAMRLLDQVESWDRTTIRCRTRSHLDPANPLRRGAGLDGIAGLEYAAQAMGVHVGLLDRTGSANGVIGYVGGLRDVRLDIDRLDKWRTELTVDAIRLFEDDRGFMYQFVISSGDRNLVSGRASIFLARTRL